MTDYKYIIKQARKFHYSKWTDEELRKCVDMLIGLERQELVSLYMSKWVSGENSERRDFQDSICRQTWKA